MDPAPEPLAPSPPEPRKPRGRVAPVVFVVVAFVLSRQVYWHQGVFFDVRMLTHDWTMHYLDLSLLRERLWESLYYLHSQPPLFNLYLGGVVNLFGESAGDVFAWSYTGMGLLMALSLYGLMVRLCVPRWPSALLTVLFMVSPATVLFENWLFYLYPETVLLCASAVCFHRFVSTGRVRSGVLLFAVLGLLALLRSAYHLVWYVGMMGLVLASCSRSSRRTVLRTAALPLLIILALYTKNALYFGTFSASSWMGLNLSRIALEATPLAERQQLVNEGLLPPLALQKAMKPLSDFAPHYRQVQGPDVPVLRSELKNHQGPNFNHQGYIQLSRDFARASLTFIRLRPLTYLSNVGRAFRLFFAPPTDYPFLVSNREQISAMNAFYNRILYGMYGASMPEIRGEWISEQESAERTLWNWLGVFVFGLGATGVLLWRERRRTGTWSAESATRMFVASNILYVSLLSNFVEYLENNRMRYAIDPLILALGATAVTECIRLLRARLKG